MKYQLGQKVFLMFNQKIQEGIVQGVFLGSNDVLTYNVKVSGVEIGLIEIQLFTTKKEANKYYKELNG